MKTIRVCTLGLLAILASATLFRPHVMNAGAGSAITPKSAPSKDATPGQKMHLAENYSKLPLSFEANQGQADSRVKFLSRGSGYTLFLTGDEAVLALQRKVAQHPPFGAAALQGPLPLSSTKKRSENEVEALTTIVNNPVPQVNQPLVPTSAIPDGAGFTLMVNGTGFVTGAVVNWDGSPRATTDVSNTQLTATINAADIAVAGTASVTVVNPTPGGGASNVVFFPITNSTSSVMFGSAPGSPVTVGTQPYSTATGDFNGDGKVDLAVANSRSNNVTILMGNGDGTFTATGSAPSTGTRPVFVAVGDFNRDGKLDLAVVNIGSRNVTILLGNGDGTFTASASSPATGASPQSVAVGDFNGDGNLDLAVANYGSDNLTVALGNGDGTFTVASSPATGSIPQFVAVGDFNGDGKLDLAVANACGNDPACSSTGTVTILLGDGAGNFSPAASSPATGFLPDSIAVGDFNHDGKLGLAVANECGNDVNCSSKGTVTILLGNGDGTFITSPSSPGTDLWPFSVAVGDFNGDGKLDLVVANGGGDNITVLLGDSTGNFTATASPPRTGVGPNSVAVGDFNGDGRLDLATADSGATNTTVSVLVQIPVATLSPVSLTFGNQNVGTTSPAQAVTLTNTGSAILSIMSISLTGTNKNDFSETKTCGKSVAPGASCTITVKFTPKATGNRTASVSIKDNAPGSPHTAALSGVGTGPNVKVTPPSLIFPTQLVSTTSNPKTVTLMNTGNATLNITSVAASGDFSQTNTCGSSVGAGLSCTFTVTFTPTGAGMRTGSVSITDDAPMSPQMIHLTGTGTIVTVSPKSVNFGRQKVGTMSGIKSVTVTNASTTTTLNISGITIGGTNSGDFAIDPSSTCPTTGGTLGPSSACSINLKFTPASTGVRKATVSISDDGGASPQVVTPSGTGT